MDTLLTHGLLADDAAGLLDAWGAGGGGAALPHGRCLAWLVSAPAFGEGAVHDLPLALGADTWCGRSRRGHDLSLRFSMLPFFIIFPCLLHCTFNKRDKIKYVHLICVFISTYIYILIRAVK